MFFSTICQIYFNYNYGASSSRWIHSPFTRCIQFAFRMLVSFLIGGFIAYGTGLRDHLTLEFMLPNMSILCIQETFGLTLSTNLYLIAVLIPLSIFFFIIQKIGLAYHDYVAGELLFLLSSFIISYRCTQISTRKLSLLFNSLFFVTIINQKNVTLIFPFELLEEFVIGMFVTVIVSLLVFPLFATFDIENRINYCLYHFQQMHYIIIQAFLCRDELSSKIFLSRAIITEKMIRKSMSLLQIRLNEAWFEPSRLLQRLVHRRRRQFLNLTIQEQIDLMNSLFLHVCSLQLMVKQCEFNDYHNECINELESSLIQLNSSQMIFISKLIPPSSVDQEEFNRYLANLYTSFDLLRSAYINTHLHRIENVLQSSKIIHSHDHLSHAFFVFQLGVIVRLLTEATNTNEKKNMTKEPKKRRSWKECWKPEWSQFLSALKSTIIIGVASIFVMVPRLADTFENGLWILVALCMTQGDTVGGAFTTMRMRLIGTLLGAMWAYVTYLSVNNDVYGTLGMLAPWIFFCGYLKLFPQWSYTVTVAASTPIVVNLGRLPFGDNLPGGDYALLRIKQNLVGISIALILTMIIFPVFAIDLLKANIQNTLNLCRENIQSIHSVYDKVFHHEHSEKVSIDFANRTDVKSFFNIQRNRFHQIISTQPMLVENASNEPSFGWLNAGFSTTRYKLLVQQQTDLYRMLHNINVAVLRISECANANEQQVEDLRIHAANGLFLPDLHDQLVDLNRQLNDCLNLWSSYFSLTQTKCFQLIRGSFHHRKHIIKKDILKYEQCLIELNRTVIRLQLQHQEATNRVLKHYFDRFESGETPTTFVPYAKNDQADSIFIAMSSMYYSTTKLAQAALHLGTTMRTVFEVETTHLYRLF